MIRSSAALVLALATPVAAEISPCDLGGASVPQRVAALESAILYGTWDGLEGAIPNIPPDARQATIDWVEGVGFDLLRCDTVFALRVPPAINRRAVVFHGADPAQMVGLYMDIVEFRDRTEIVLLNMTQSMEDLMRMVR